MKHFVLCSLLLAACRDPLVFPDAQMDVVDAPDVADIVDMVDATDTPDAAPCGAGCLAPGWLCRERGPGDWGCEPPVVDGGCPGEGVAWQNCDDRCWQTTNPLHCGTCSTMCTDAQVCFGNNDAGRYTCM